MSRRWKVALCVGGALIAINVALSLLASWTGGTPGGPTSSSYATGDDGLAAFASLVARAGHPVRRLREPAATADLDPDTTLVVLDPTFVTSDDARALQRFVNEGGRLVAGGSRAQPWLRRVLPGAPRWSPDGTRSATPVVPIPELAQVRRVELNGDGSWAASGRSLPTLAGNGRTVVSVATPGRGRALLVADASPLENQLLAEADNAALGLGLAGPPGRPVVFPESYHGYGKSSGAGAIPGRWQALLALAGIAVLAYMLARARRLGPAEPERRELAPPRRAYVDALAALIARTRDRRTVAEALRARAQAVVTRSTGTGDLTGAAALGLEPDEIGALLHTEPSDAGLLAAARSLAKLERTATRRVA